MADPMYRQIADDLRRQIEARRACRPGAQLRTELELREKYEASRNTVRDAIKWLVTRGLVETRPGQGTFVVEKIVPFVTTLTGAPGDRVRRRGTSPTADGARRAARPIPTTTAKLREPTAPASQPKIREASSQPPCSPGNCRSRPNAAGW